MSHYTYTTLLSTDDYLLPVCALHHSFQLSQSQHDFVVIATDALSPETFQTLTKLNIKYKVFPDLRHFIPQALEKENRTALNQQEFFLVMCLNKFYMFDLKEYDKVCFLDGDMIIRENIDFIFNFNTPAGKFLNENQVAAEAMLISPKDFSSKHIIEKFGIFAFDEEILRCLYPFYQITDLKLSDWSHLIFHAHAHCNRFRYWLYFDVNELDLCLKFIDKIVTDEDAFNKFYEGKSWCGDHNDEFFESYNQSEAFSLTDSEDYKDKIDRQDIEEFDKLYKQFLQKR